MVWSEASRQLQFCWRPATEPPRAAGVIPDINGDAHLLKIKTYLAESRLHGLGVFAAEPARKGSVVWAYEPKVDVFIPADRYDEIPMFLQKYFDSYVYAEHSLLGGGYIYCADHAKFINHSRDPNTSTVGDTYYALKDIAEDDEITCDYRNFSWGDQPKPGYL